MIYYVGSKKKTGKYERFAVEQEIPLDGCKEYVDKYRFIIGPFRTPVGAYVMATIGQSNPSIQCVDDAEAYASQLISKNKLYDVLPHYKPDYVLCGYDDWSRRLYKSCKSGNIYVDVDGVLHTITDWGEPCDPIIAIEKINVIEP